MKKRILGLLLAVCLCIGLLPVMALADTPAAETWVAQIGTKQFATLAAAVADASDGDTITMLQDVQLNSYIGISKTLTLDLNGKTIDGVERCNIAFEISGTGAKLTVKDSSAGKNGAIRSGKSGASAGSASGNTIYVIDGGSFVLQSGNLYSKNNAITSLSGSAEIRIEGGTVTAEATTNASAVLYLASSSGTTTVTITGGTLSGQDGAKIWGKDNSFTMSGGSLTATAGTGILTNGLCENTSVTVNGTARVSGKDTAIYHPDAGTLNIGGEAVLTGDTGILVKSGTVNISGGTICGIGAKAAYVPTSNGCNGTGDGLYVENYASSGGYATPTVTITGGTFKSENADAVGSYGNPGNSMPKLQQFIAGGNFSTNPDGLCIEGYSGYQNPNGSFGVAPENKDAAVTIVVWPEDAGISLKKDGVEIGNAAGTFTLPEGSYTLTVSKDGYQTGVRTFTVTAQRAQTVSVTLTADNSGVLTPSVTTKPTFTVTVAKAAHGTVFVSATRADSGRAVVLTVEPSLGYKLDDIRVVDENGNAVALTLREDGRYSFTMPQCAVTVRARFVLENWVNPFVDVTDTQWYFEAISWGCRMGLVSGTSATTFSPDAACTRAQIVTLLWRVAGEPEPARKTSAFADVGYGSYYRTAVLWAVENGIVSGTSATTFSPDATCTRAQAVTLLLRYMAAQGMNAVTMQELVSGYADAAQTPGYALSAFNWALAAQLVEGANGKLMPNGACTRAQIVTILYRAFAK